MMPTAMATIANAEATGIILFRISKIPTVADANGTTTTIDASTVIDARQPSKVAMDPVRN